MAANKVSVLFPAMNPKPLILDKISVNQSAFLRYPSPPLFYYPTPASLPATRSGPSPVLKPT
jgi:hypothetical protein